MRRKPADEQPLKRRNLPLMMLHAREHVIAHFRPVLKANGITEQQWRIVRLLLETGLPRTARKSASCAAYRVRAWPACCRAWNKWAWCGAGACRTINAACMSR